MRAELPSGKLRHQLHFGVRRHREHIAVKVDRTPRGYPKLCVNLRCGVE